ncbi:hypothetical protein C1H46_035308 [Malus baccata]|uniref:Uncharacterized protein n=1 Tax=Malus baccata TaxID=106549 RepID=A0A540KY50_MALBA|nr:hypothetical protein C1H46_035308 [Malus baccata]
MSQTRALDRLPSLPFPSLCTMALPLFNIYFNEFLAIPSEGRVVMKPHVRLLWKEEKRNERNERGDCPIRMKK